MKPRRAEDLRGLSEDELPKVLLDAQETLMNMQFQHALGELENPDYLRTMRRDIARIKTVMSEKAQQNNKA